MSSENIEAAISIGVINDLLCIFSKKQQTTYFLDVAALFSDDTRVFREIVEMYEPIGDASVPHIHGESLSFLAPSYFLDTNGQGKLISPSSVNTNFSFPCCIEYTKSLISFISLPMIIQSST